MVDVKYFVAVTADQNVSGSEGPSAPLAGGGHAEPTPAALRDRPLGGRFLHEAGSTHTLKCCELLSCDSSLRLHFKGKETSISEALVCAR